MSEPSTSESSPEPQNDESVVSTNIKLNQDGGTSKQASTDIAIASTSKDNTPSASTPKDTFKSHTLSALGSLHQYIFNDKDEDASNDEYDLLRFSDNDGTTSSDNSESNRGVSLINEITNTIIISNESVAKKKMMIKDTSDTKENTNENTSSSDEEADYDINQASDGGEASKTKVASFGPGKNEQDSNSSDEESDCILSQVKANINYVGECSKTQHVTKKEEDDLSSSDEDAKYIPSYIQTSFNDGGECSKAIDVIDGPSNEKNQSNDGGANMPSRANPNDDNKSTKTEVALRPSDEGQTQIKPIRNKAERKLNYTIPFKKTKKF